MTVTNIPTDLKSAAIKAARRLQSLTNQRIYVIVLVKTSEHWLLSIVDDKGTKIEKMK